MHHLGKLIAHLNYSKHSIILTNYDTKKKNYIHSFIQVASADSHALTHDGVGASRSNEVAHELSQQTTFKACK